MQLEIALPEVAKDHSHLRFSVAIKMVEFPIIFITISATFRNQKKNYNPVENRTLESAHDL